MDFFLTLTQTSDNILYIYRALKINQKKRMLGTTESKRSQGLAPTDPEAQCLENTAHRPARKDGSFPDDWSKLGLAGGLRNVWLFLSSLISVVATGSPSPPKTPRMRDMRFENRIQLLHKFVRVLGAR